MFVRKTSGLLALAAVLLLAAPSSAAVKDVHLVVGESLSASTVSPGGSFTTDFSVQNTGDADPGAFTLELNLGVGRWTVGTANDGCSRPNDFDIVCSLTGLAPGARFATSVVVTLGSDATPGAIYDVRIGARNGSTNFGVDSGTSKSTMVGQATPAPPPPPGPPKVCSVPRVIGMTLAAAKQRLTRAVCTLGTVTTRKAARAQVGHVVAQRPAAGEYLAAHGKVAVVLGRRA